MKKGARGGGSVQAKGRQDSGTRHAGGFWGRASLYAAATVVVGCLALYLGSGNGTTATGAVLAPQGAVLAHRRWDVPCAKAQGKRFPGMLAGFGLSVTLGYVPVRY